MDKPLGPNGTYPKLLGEAREEIAGSLVKIFASSLVTDKVPEGWRAANVVGLSNEIEKIEGIIGKIPHRPHHN